MRITVTTAELLAVLDQRAPGLVPDLGVADGALVVRLDAHHLRGVPAVLRWLVGTVTVELRPLGLADGTATFDVDVTTRHVHVERIVQMVLAHLKDRGGPEPLRYLTPRRDGAAVVVDVAVDRAAADTLGDPRLTGLALGDAAVVLDVDLTPP